MDMQSDKCNNTEKHMLSDTWVLWAHLPHNTDWSPNSYINIAEFDTLEYTIALVEYLPDSLIDNCMLFMMRKGIKPSWEDTRNRNGGCFSYKVSNRNVHQTWKELTYSVVGNTISSKEEFVNCVTGITISPKKNFCVVKIWMTDCTNQDSSEVVKTIKDITSTGCIFKKHVPEY